MSLLSRRSVLCRFIAALAAGTLAAHLSAAQVLRIVTYNTANDVSGNVNVDYLPRTGAANVLQAIGALSNTGPAHPIDILALQESVYYTGAGINPTAQGFVNVLNSIYGPGTYAAATLNGTTSGNLTGNGPNTLVYRTATLQLVSQLALGSPSGSTPPRQVMRYQFQPIGYPASSQFYLFNSHYKSGTASSDNTRRGLEASLITTNVNALPNNSNVIFVGDYNPTNNTSDAGYQGIISGPTSNHGIDPLNPTNTSQNWSISSSLALETATPSTTVFFTGQSTGGMHYRDDMLLHTPAIQTGPALKYVPNSHITFGNTGTHTYLGAITTGNSTTFASMLTGYTPAQAATVLADLAKVSDHLPVVADYALPPLAPGVFSLSSPANAAIDLPLTPTFSWTPSANATTYSIKVATDPALTAVVASASGLNTTSWTIPANLLSECGLYYWGVTATNSSASTTSSPANFSFATHIHADINHDGTADLADFFLFFNCFDATDICADINNDTQVDLADFFEFFTVFDQGGC